MPLDCWLNINDIPSSTFLNVCQWNELGHPQICSWSQVLTMHTWLCFPKVFALELDSVLTIISVCVFQIHNNIDSEAMRRSAGESIGDSIEGDLQGSRSAVAFSFKTGVSSNGVRIGLGLILVGGCPSGQCVF